MQNGGKQGRPIGREGDLKVEKKKGIMGDLGKKKDGEG